MMIPQPTPSVTLLLFLALLSVNGLHTRRQGVNYNTFLMPNLLAKVGGSLQDPSKPSITNINYSFASGVSTQLYNSTLAGQGVASPVGEPLHTIQHNRMVRGSQRICNPQFLCNEDAVITAEKPGVRWGLIGGVTVGVLGLVGGGLFWYFKYGPGSH